MKAEGDAGKRSVSLIGALHGEIGPLVTMGALEPIDDVAARLSGRGIPASLMQLGKLGTPNQQYIPWRRIPAHRLLIAGLFVWAVGSAAAPLAASATLVGALLLCAQQLIGDAGGIAVQITDRTLRQSHTPDTHLARVDASIRTVTHGFTLAGALLSGMLVEVFGARPLLFASSALIGLAGVVALFSACGPEAKIGGLRKPPDPSEGRHEPRRVCAEPRPHAAMNPPAIQYETFDEPPAPALLVVDAGDHTSAIAEANAKIRAAAEELDALIERSELERYGKSTFPSVLDLVRQDRFPDILPKGLKTQPIKVYKGKDAGKKQYYDEIVAKWEAVVSELAVYVELYAESYYYPYFKVYEAVRETIERVKIKEETVFIEDINHTLAEYITKNIVPDVYFRIGETVYHYLIDEFQDTSPVQWKNLFPLVENSLSQQGSSWWVIPSRRSMGSGMLTTGS